MMLSKIIEYIMDLFWIIWALVGKIELSNWIVDILGYFSHNKDREPTDKFFANW